VNILHDELKSWQLCSIEESFSNLKSKDLQNSMFIVGNQISQLDLFCYLHARFGIPNGIQMALKKQGDTDNLVHWHYALKSDTYFIEFAGD
jgi:hypothetical protein